MKLKNIDDFIFEGVATKSDVHKLFNAGKSLPVVKSVSLLKQAGYQVEHETYKGYKDKHIPGKRYVLSRKEVTYWKVTIKKNDHKVATYSNETSVHASYSLTGFVLDHM